MDWSGLIMCSECVHIVSPSVHWAKRHRSTESWLEVVSLKYVKNIDTIKHVIVTSRWRWMGANDLCVITVSLENTVCYGLGLQSLTYLHSESVIVCMVPAECYPKIEPAVSAIYFSLDSRTATKTRTLTYQVNRCKTTWTEVSWNKKNSRKCRYEKKKEKMKDSFYWQPEDSILIEKL